jgi:DNA (cytosine-5)-methyltransferase 1
MTHGSLFSGIGGFDLAAEWMGWENKFHCEWNPFGQKVLQYYWPNAESFTDITKTNFEKYANKIDILTGGFPCQPYSQAGKRKGKEDERHLWPHMLRAIKEIAPSYIVGENVRGITNWNGGLVFDEVCAEMENIGYQVAPVLIPASGVGAPHRRERIWFVAYRDSNLFNECNGNNEVNTSERGFNAFGDINEGNDNGDAANTDSTNCETRSQREILGQPHREKANGYSNVECTNKWENFPTVSPICNGDDGLSDRLDNITFPKWRNESIKAGGNAIVPQVALQIFKAIQEHKNQIK